MLNFRVKQDRQRVYDTYQCFVLTISQSALVPLCLVSQIRDWLCFVLIFFSNLILFEKLTLPLMEFQVNFVECSSEFFLIFSLITPKLYRYLFPITLHFKILKTILPFKYHVSSVNCSSQETEVTSTPTRPVENVLATKGLQERNIY